MLIMVAVYTANLAALFSTNVQEKPIKSIGDLIESENTFFASKDSALLLPQLNNPIIDHLLDEGRIEFPFEVNWGKKKQMVKEIEERLQKGAIWIAVDATIDVVAEDIRNLYKLDGYFAKVGFSFLMRNDWVWADRVKRKFAEFGYSGYFDQLDRKYKSEDMSNESLAIKPISFKSLAFLFATTFAAGVCATLLQVFFFFFGGKQKLMP